MLTLLTRIFRICTIPLRRWKCGFPERPPKARSSEERRRYFVRTILISLLEREPTEEEIVGRLAMYLGKQSNACEGDVDDAIEFDFVNLRVK